MSTFNGNESKNQIDIQKLTNLQWMHIDFKEFYFQKAEEKKRADFFYQNDRVASLSKCT